MDSQTEVNILLLGNQNVGKTTFLLRISQGSTSHPSGTTINLLRNEDHQPFVFDIQFFNRSYRFKFCDIDNSSDWTLLNPDFIVLCYDISNRSSLTDLQRKWIKEVQIYFTSKKDIPVLLLGLKRDLRSETDPNGIIYPQEAHRIAQEMRCDKYMECSAVTGELIREVFEDISRTAAMTGTAKGGLSEGGNGLM